MGPEGYDLSARERSQRIVEAFRRAFVQFLTIPSGVILVFLCLAAVTYFLDRLRIENDWPALFPGTHDSARSFLGTIASGIITVTSITFSLLLLAVQQGAAALTSQVYDQFLRRRANQLYFGFFVGLALYCLVILATIHPDYTPNYGVALAFVLTIVALYMLILLIYTTIDQSRPVMVIAAIRDHALLARKLQQSDLLQATRGAGRLSAFTASTIEAEESGFLTWIDAKRMDKGAEKIGNEVEIVILKSIGDYVAFGDTIAEIRINGAEASSDLQNCVRSSLSLETQRDLETDPAYGIEQLETIGWTSISTAKSNPRPGLLCCWMLRDLMVRWYGNGHETDTGERSPSSVVIYRDSLPEVLMDALESLAVIASESMQHQTIAEIYSSFAESFERLPPALQARAASLLLRSLSALGDHVPTARLSDALSALATMLAKSGYRDAAQAIHTAHGRLMASAGRFHARSTRAG